MRFAIPKPPPRRSANAAIARSASASASGRRSPARSASQSSRRPGGASRSASVSAWPLPRRGKPQHARAGRLGPVRGPVARAVVGDEDLGAGELLAQRLDGRGDPRRLVARGDEDASGQPLAGSGSIGGIKASSPSRMPYWPSGPPASSSASASRPVGLLTSSTVESPFARVDADRRRLDASECLDADGRDARVAEARRRGRSGTAPSRPAAATRCGRRRRRRPGRSAPALLLDELPADERVQSGVSPPFDELAARGRGRALPCRRRRRSRERGAARQRGLHLRRSMGSFSARTNATPPAGVAERLPDARAEVVVDRADEDERDPLAVEAACS